MVTTLIVTTYLPGRDCLSNTDETSIVETTSVVYYKLKLNIMELVRTFTCDLTGETVNIYLTPEGTEIALSSENDYSQFPEDEQEIEAICIEYLLS